MSALELWGGVECTVNRVGDVYRDQMVLTGHQEREDDIDRLAALGLSTMRYPVLWERVAPNSPDELDWSWSDRRLARLRQAGIAPIVGLVHHGSGPRYTSLLDDNFAPGLAAFAGAAARRYPWVTSWTPVNEPLTTARFSALYGHWYPHARDERLFWIALLNQIDAVRLSMRAIREVTPAARLVQTDDLGRTYATAGLARQAAFDNARRWMSWDLLSGRVVPGHALWSRLWGFGLEPRLEAIADYPSPPDLIGINHYLTSDRFLDHRIGRYPPASRGGNAQQAYADVEAVRVLRPPPPGIRGAMREAWERYRTPIALTEVHNGCSREEQLRWFRDAWLAARRARREGIDVRAVTCWALFGSSGWDTLLTGEGHYEPGPFDVRGAQPRATALAGLLPSLASTSAEHPRARGPGWWRRDIRLHYSPAGVPAPAADHGSGEHKAAGAQPILVIGASGTLGQAMAAACRHRGLRHVLTSRRELDLLDPASIAHALERHQPWAVINCGGWVRVDDAEDDPEGCIAANAQGAAALAQACAARDIATLSFSSDLVFAGRKRTSYVESDRPAPANVYGRSKAMMESAIVSLPGAHLIVRTAAFFSPFDQANFAVHAARALSAGRPFTAAGDCQVTPTYVPDLCDASLDLLLDGETGTWHLSNGEPVSWHAFAQRLACGLGHDPELITALPAGQMGWRARRPRSTALSSERGNLLPPLQSAIDRFCAVASPARARLVSG